MSHVQMSILINFCPYISNWIFMRKQWMFFNFYYKLFGIFFGTTWKYSIASSPKKNWKKSKINFSWQHCNDISITKSSFQRPRNASKYFYSDIKIPIKSILLFLQRKNIKFHFFSYLSIHIFFALCWELCVVSELLLWIKPQSRAKWKYYEEEKEEKEMNLISFRINVSFYILFSGNVERSIEQLTKWNESSKK